MLFRSLRYRFQCREWSAATGLVNFRMRWYDSETGRWLTKDPIGLSGGLNLYAFCMQNPMKFIDAFGQDTYVPDNSRHGSPHVDRYHGSTNVGRYNKDGSGIRHKGRMPPRIPKSDMGSFSAAASKLRCGLGFLSLVQGVIEDINLYIRARANGRSYSEQFEEEYKDVEFFITPIGIIPNPHYKLPLKA